MYINRKFPYKIVFFWSLSSLITFFIWSSLVVLVYNYAQWHFLAFPFLPIATIGTALAFYLGMKNTSSYDRLWEARKIWGSIVNDSRAWASMLNSYITKVNNPQLSEEDIKTLKETLAKRHIDWLYAHKYALRHKRTSWEHSKKANEIFRTKIQSHFSASVVLENDLHRYLSHEEIQQVKDMVNTASQLLNKQSMALKELRDQNIIEDFRLFEMQNHINKLFEHQGKNERIKNFPFPMQYSWMLRMSVFVFCFLLPFGLLTELNKQGAGFIWLTIPFSALISWVFRFMEMVGDYSENPFEGLAFDIPMNSMTRTIEIDMLQMLGVKDIPEPILAKDGILM